MTTWRYQPVFVEQGGKRAYSLCEVYLDDEGRLDSWTLEASLPAPAIAPMGEDMAALVADLGRMLADALSYRPVPYEDLRPSLTLPRRTPGTGVEP